MDGCAIDQRLDRLRDGVARVSAADLAGEVAAGAVLIDTRPVDQRCRGGELVGALVIDRNVLEWRLDPTSPDRIAEASYGVRLIVVCNEGYSSTLAAHSLRELGLDATDLIGGVQALLDDEAATPSASRLLRPADGWRPDVRSAPPGGFSRAQRHREPRRDPRCA